MDAMGENLVCKYTTPETAPEELFTPIYVDGMIIALGAGKAAHPRPPTNFPPLVPPVPGFGVATDPHLYVIDAHNCEELYREPAPKAPGGAGAALSIADSTIFFGGGFFGPTGLTAVEVAK